MPATLSCDYGPATGPLGFPMLDKQAFALEEILKRLPQEPAYQYRKALLTRAPTEVSPEGRTDVSWITTEDVDRQGDVVLAGGMDDSQYRLNPIVTMQHDYAVPPVGKSLWRKVVQEGKLRGVKAKTRYPDRPDDWPKDKEWPADLAFALIQADLLRGKSIGFLPTKVHIPTREERDRNGWIAKDLLVIDAWILLEYACVFLPAQQNAVLESVSKSLAPSPLPGERAGERGFAFTTLPEIEKALARMLADLDLEKIIENRLDQLQGRIG